MKRSSGIIMHISSLGEKYGIGTFGREAYRFADFLDRAGQKYWQILPLGHTSYGDSPYQNFSAFAGNPYFIDFDLLVEEEGLLVEEDFKYRDFGDNPKKVDYEKLFNERVKVLEIAYKNSKGKLDAQIKAFKDENYFWLDDYALFMSIKEKMDYVAFTEWPDDIRFYQEEAVSKYKMELKDRIGFWEFVQYEFYKQWTELKTYVNSLGIQFIGDLPIYVAFDSAETWATPHLFKLDENKVPTVVAGCPPDAFSSTGQLWGNPIYNWDAMEDDNYSWWITRIKQNLLLFDVIRIDHFKGFESFWEVPYGDETAQHGKWAKGPKMRLFNAIKKALGDIEIIAEDLGYITEETREMVRETGYPGMKVLEFAFDSRETSDYIPYEYDHHCVVYTGTHDNDTSIGWIETSGVKEDVELAKDYLQLNLAEGYNWGFIRGAFSSTANVAITQMQDVLGLGSKARMNIPSTLGGNWTWRVNPDLLTTELAEKLYAITKLYGRRKKGSSITKRRLDKKAVLASMATYAKVKYGRSIEHADYKEILNCLGLALLEQIQDDIDKTSELYDKTKRAYYFSAEYLMGRALGNNLISLGLYDEVKEILEQLDIDINKVEDAEDDATLGNGGLGRLAACFMDSGASCNLPLMGYGIRYSNGLFRQIIRDGAQYEVADNWGSDPFSIRKDYLAVDIEFNGETIKAVPYDMPIIGYGTYNINTLRLWKSEPIVSFNFTLFNAQRYDDSVREKCRAEDISRVLYPNDSNWEGKRLRLKQQYFLASASLQDIIRSHKNNHSDMRDFDKWHVIQLNDTHPTISIPEFIRLLVDQEGIEFDVALGLARKVFAYTNHTILQEALEKWDINLLRDLLPRIFEIIQTIDHVCMGALSNKNYSDYQIHSYRILKDNKVHMANLAIHIGFAVNGVAALHTKILKETEFANWYHLYPQKFQNKTNGITPRRWIRYANPELSKYITKLLGNPDWIKDLSLLKGLEAYLEDDIVLDKIMKIKHHNKKVLATYVLEHEGITVDPDAIFDIQVKRLHEYKRQFLNALYILDLYFRLKDDPELDIPKITFFFGAKAFPGYARAKGIVRFIGEISKLIANDPVVKDRLQVIFVENYRVTYAEKLVPAADVSKQISTAGKEASGTGNMKFMLNGAPTFGTYDGANVEIVAESGEENNFIFGLRVEDIEEIQNGYDPVKIYNQNPDIKRVVDALIDGTVSDHGTGEFHALYDCLVKQDGWNRPDEYYILGDFEAFKAEEDKVFAAYKDKRKWAQMCLKNIANAGIFSSDRTIMEYAADIWHIKPSPLKKK